ncbi:MAG TPA: class I SAM-dependent methyltransferase [Gemmatimonadaceae bacterium]
MNSSQRDRDDYEFLTTTGEAAHAQALPHFLHLDQPVGRWNYIRIANEIAERIPAGRLLDWGCGFGQMTYLLRRRGFVVTPFDVGADTQLPDVPLTRDLHVVRSAHPTQLPFASHSFDAVLSCGVLEHVDEFSETGNEIESLREIRRVLRPNGHFAIYQLPQRAAWQEALIRALDLGYTHPRRFSEEEIRDLLARTGYRIERMRRNNLLPKNLTGLPERVRAYYSKAGRTLIYLDGLLCRVPGVNRLAGVLEIMARSA